VIRVAFSGRLLALGLCSGHEQVSGPLLAPLLLLQAVKGAFASVLVSLGIPPGAVKNRSDRLLARSMAGGDVEELLGSLGALAPQLVD
jgi:hypothetical protein